MNGDSEHGNLLSTFPARRGGMPSCLRRADDWDVISGRWVRESDCSVVLNGNGEEVESMAVTGSRKWSSIELRARFRFLSGTVRPPDGGAILFFLARNAANHLAFHYCVGKNRVQLFKKARGVWTMLGEQNFVFELNRDYLAEIRSRPGAHECLMEDGTHLRFDDHEVSRGRVGIGGKFCAVRFSFFQVNPLSGGETYSA